MVRYYWTKYKKRKAAKAAKAKAAKEALAKKKARSRTMAMPDIAPVSPVKGKKGKKVEVVATKGSDILNIISTDIKEAVKEETLEHLLPNEDLEDEEKDGFDERLREIAENTQKGSEDGGEAKDEADGPDEKGGDDDEP